MVDRLLQFEQTDTVEKSYKKRSSTEITPLSYGKDLWDCLTVLQDNTTTKTNFMKCLKNYFQAYKKSLDIFTSSLVKANFQFEKDFVSKLGQDDQIVDTLSTSMVNIKGCMDVVIKNIAEKAEMIQRDLVEPLELYYKHYYSTNNELIKQGTHFWNNLHEERTQMLFAKENYFNQMFTLQQHQYQYQEAAMSTFGSSQSSSPDMRNNNHNSSQSHGNGNDDMAFTGIQDKKLKQLQNKADISKNEYERQLNKLNLTIDMFDTSYKPILNRIQESDDSIINFIKYNLEKFSRYIEQMGKDFRISSDEISQTIAMISSDTDIQIFIDNHHSQNQFLQKEDFQLFEQSKMDVMGRVKNRNINDDISYQFEVAGKTSMSLISSQPVIDENYIAKSLIKENSKDSNGNEEGFEVLNAKDTYQADRQLIIDQVVKLLRSDPITIEEKGALIQMMHNRTLRSVMSEILNDITSPKQVQSVECLKLFADIIKFILTCKLYFNFINFFLVFVHEQSQDFKLLYTIMESSQNIYSTVNKRKHFVYTILADHGIWSDVKNWRDCIQEIITMKIAEANRRKMRKERHSSSKSLSASKDQNIFKKGFKSLKGMLQSKEKSLQDDLKQNQNLIFNELSKFVTYFINFGLPYDQANEILLAYCDYFLLEQSRIHLLLTELQSNQKNTSQMFTEKELLIWSLQKRGNRLKSYGLSDQMQIIGMTIKFVDSDQTLRNILLLCKNFNDLLKQDIYKQSLLRASQDRLKKKRKILWLKILNIDSRYVQGEYETYYQQSLMTIPKGVSDSIEVDVNRSFNNLKKITPDNLNNILKTYAIVNHSLDYCQGMNFIAGFIFLLFEKESMAFAVMKEVINKFRMSELFNTELPMLKLNFYQLDRLISIILPDLHSHFKDETINSSYFSSPYFITLFTSVLQMQSTGDHCAKLLRLWDYFIIVTFYQMSKFFPQHGWKAIFKVSLTILKENEETLLTMPFEVMLTQVVNLPVKFFIVPFKDEKEEKEGVIKYDQQLKDLKIPTMLLERLKKEFDQNYKIAVKTSTTSPDVLQQKYNR